MAALFAHQRRRITAPVEKQNRLLAFLQALRDGFLQLRRKDRRAFFFVSGLSHVHHANARHFLVIHALRQFQQREFTLLTVVKTFQRRRGRAEHDDRAFHLPAHHRHIACVVTRRFLLLVSVLMLLVHDDEAKRFHRRKDRRTRADDDARAALPDLVPFIMPLSGTQMRMQDGDKRLQFSRTEPRLEPLHRLRRQRNFRHEHDRALTLLQRVRDGLQIHLRLARTRDAMQKESCGRRIESAFVSLRRDRDGEWRSGNCARLAPGNTRVSRVKFSVPLNFLRRSRNRGRPNVRILIHRADKAELARVIPDVIPLLVQIGFGTDHPVERFIRPHRPAALHHCVHLMRGKRFYAVQNFRKRMHAFLATLLNG